MRRDHFLAFVALSLLGCNDCDKESDFFDPGTQIFDIDAPVIRDIYPDHALSGPFNIDQVGFQVVDLPGANGATPSGVDVNSIEVLRGSTPMTATRSGDDYSVALTGVADGQVVLTLGAKDNYGNHSSGVINVLLKRDDPLVAFSSTPQANWQSNQFVETLRWSGMIMGPYLDRAFGGLYHAGSDGQCHRDNSLLWQVGSETPGRVSQNTFDYGLSGLFDISLSAWNGVLAGGAPATGHYCFGVTAEDRATDAFGAPNPNRTTLFHQSNLTWNPLPAVHDVVVTPSSSTVFTGQTQQLMATVNADPGVATTVDWSGSPGTVATVSQSGLVTTVGPGAFSVQACSTVDPSKCGTGTVTVQNPQVHSVTVTPDNVTLTHPTTQQMTATVDADPGASTAVTWSASPESVGTVDQTGKVTTVGPGVLDVLACSVVLVTICRHAFLNITSAFDFFVAISLASWIHHAFGGGPSNTCTEGGAQAASNLLAGPGSASALAGSPYTVSWSGPGLVGSSTRNGTLDSNGRFFDRQAIASFGTYTVTVSVTSGGLTRTATAMTTVNSGAGSCPAP